jgi:hypothetical protein
MKELARIDIDDMIHMTPDEFEELVAALFRARGSLGAGRRQCGGFSPEAALAGLVSREF